LSDSSKYASERWFNVPPHLYIVHTLPWETLNPKNHEFSLKLQISVMISIAVSEIGMTKSMDSITAMPYSLRGCCQRSSMLQAIRLSFNKTIYPPSRHAIYTIKLLQQETPHFIGPDLWPLNSQDLNQVDYKVWGVMQQVVYEVV